MPAQPCFSKGIKEYGTGLNRVLWQLAWPVAQQAPRTTRQILLLTKIKSQRTKLNTDGAAKGNSRNNDCGGLLQNEEGRWLAGYAHKTGVGTTFQAKLMGV
ncbi:hypothetical protein PIB30_071951 [Stylosanthes scabra]|uniref:Uncharacterized protein n=1 Tax=Stylosanthes scabra TaxID=79078 RepID=A0ABU6VMB3_9FABA|nr:hypothetical protein [Stylosanthes scabra]